MKAKYNRNNNVVVAGQESWVQILLGIMSKSPLLSFFWKMKFQNHAFIAQSCVDGVRGQCD